MKSTTLFWRYTWRTPVRSAIPQHATFSQSYSVSRNPMREHLRVFENGMAPRRYFDEQFSGITYLTIDRLLQAAFHDETVVVPKRWSRITAKRFSKFKYADFMKDFRKLNPNLHSPFSERSAADYALNECLGKKKSYNWEQLSLHDVERVKKEREEYWDEQLQKEDEERWKGWSPKERKEWEEYYEEKHRARVAREETSS